MTDFLQIVLSGIAIGAIYSLAALGFTVVFNATKVTNFANGEFVMMGGLVCAFLVVDRHWPLPWACVATVAAVTALGVALDRFGLQPSRRKTVLSYAMITIGCSILFRGLMQVAVSRDVMFLEPFGVIPDLRAFGVYFASQSLWILGTLAVVAAGLRYLYARTRIGKAMRAASQSPRAAALCGIEPTHMSALAFAIAAGLGALAGALVAPIGAAYYEYGLTFGLKGFAAAVLGGFGSPVGAVLGGLLIGELQSLTNLAYAPASNVVIYLCMALVLLFRPQGLLGESEVIRQS